jgi:glutamate/tyrosine decarboxylase-like PLP-dependent enzyme
VCAQAGNVNTGAFDPLPQITAAVREHAGWTHVDGAFGLWASAAPSLRRLADGVGEADSWTTDSHKWLNVPYDSGIVAVRDAASHHAAMTLGAAYYVETAGAERDNYNWVAESSRRARGFAVYAALLALGRRGLADRIEHSCGLARKFAEALGREPGVEVRNEVVLNQVLVRFAGPGDDDAAADARTREVIAAVQRDGTCWLGGTTWQGRVYMRISVSNWSTTEADVDASVGAILRCARQVGQAAAASR